MAECPEETKKHVTKTFEIAGFQFPLSPLITPESIQRYFSVRPRPNDIIISSYPKSDSNFVDLIVWKLLFPRQPVQELNNVTNRYLPCMEMTIAEDYMKNMQQHALKYSYPRLFKTYLPFRLIPMYKKAKYIYVVRTPWEVCSSYYRLLRQMNCTGDSFEDFIKDFLTGDVAYESIFDHVAPWIKVSETENVLILSYEHIHHNPRSSMFTIAAFLGDTYLQQLIDFPEFEINILKALKWDKSKKCKSDEMDSPLVKMIARSTLVIEEPSVKFIRKPVLFSSQIIAIAEKMSEVFIGTSIEQLWLNLLEKKLAMLSKVYI